MNIPLFVQTGDLKGELLQYLGHNRSTPRVRGLQYHLTRQYELTVYNYDSQPNLCRFIHLLQEVRDGLESKRRIRIQVYHPYEPVSQLSHWMHTNTQHYVIVEEPCEESSVCERKDYKKEDLSGSNTAKRRDFHEDEW